MLAIKVWNRISNNQKVSCVNVETGVRGASVEKRCILNSLFVPHKGSKHQIIDIKAENDVLVLYIKYKY